MNKKRKGDILFICVVFVVTLIGIFGYWLFQIGRHEGQRASAEVKKSEVNNYSSEEIITVHSTFYNYRSDNEISSGKRNQGAQGLYAVEAVPFTKFNKLLSTYYTGKNVSGIYTGNFYNYYQNLLVSGQTAITWPNYAKFYWAANIANRGTYSSVCQGIVSSSLKGFASSDICSGTLVASNGTTAVPYFNETFLAQTSGGNPIGYVKEDVGFPFRKAYSSSKGEYYEFDSIKDVVRFSGLPSDQSQASSETDYFGTDDGTLSYYYKNRRVYIMGSDRTRSATSQFLPFNSGEDINISNSNAFSTNKAYMQKIDYGFGLRLDIPFRLSDDGRVDGKDMVFEFSGDDDVWIFVDGELVMDLGGQHAEATGKINFAGSSNTAVATVNHVTFKNGSTTASNTAKSNSIMANDTYSKKVTKTFSITKGSANEHVITVFYMERGMYDSNFKMAFNFVPKDDPEVEATVAPTATVSSTTPTPQPADRSDSLTIQNEVVAPAVLNTVFEEEVWKTVEEDVFQYTVANKGTSSGSVGDSGLQYPSGKLTVRERDGCDKKYLSFGEKPVVRIYFDLQSAKDNASDFNKGTSDSDNSRYILTWTKPYVYIGSNYYEMTYYSGDYYYMDFEIGTSFKFSNNQKNSESQWGPCYSKTITVTKDMNGVLYSASYVENSRQWVFICETEDAGDTHPALNTGIAYSQNLPYQTPGVTSTYAPDDTNTSSYQAVTDTTYQITEAYPAATSPVNANILVNDATGATRNTDANGNIALLSDDAGTFYKQFAEGSVMYVRYKEELQKMEAKATVPSGTDISSATAENYISYATDRTEDEMRLLSQYYTTSMAAVSKETVNGTETEQSVNVKAASATFDYKRVQANSTGDLQITETFTHTVKTGDLYIYKELQGLMEDDADTTGWKERYEKEYTFIIQFSNVFGGTSAVTPYNGTAVRYTRADKDSGYTDEETITITNGEITLTGNQYVVITGIPVGTTYTIQETDPADTSVMGSVSIQYKVNSDGEVFTSPAYQSAGEPGVITIDKSNRIIEGVIPGEVTDSASEQSTTDYVSVDVKIMFTNQWGAITLTKELAGEQSYANDRTYQFLIEVGDGTTYTNFSGMGVIRTEKKEADASGEITTTITTKVYTVTDGVVELKAGQTFTLGELDLAANKKYMITELVPSNAIYECSHVEKNGVRAEGSSIVAADDTQQTQIMYTVETENGVNETTPNYDYVFINKYYEPYIIVEKYFDQKYYEDEEFCDGKTYEELTGAEQSFLFTVREYEDANCTKFVKEFAVILSSSDAQVEQTTVDGTEYTYKVSKKIKVDADHYYKVTEDTGWSWKYTLKKIAVDGSFEAVANNDDGYAVVKGTRADGTNIPDTAIFYNKRNADTPEGDTHVVINNIKVTSEP